MEILEGAQMEAVKGADVIVTNPDHVAVALKYDQRRTARPAWCSPRASTPGPRRCASWPSTTDVPMLRNVPLAHALCRVDVNQEVPEDALRRGGRGAELRLPAASAGRPGGARA